MNIRPVLPGLVLACAVLLLSRPAQAQAVETYAGHERAGVDILWYRFFPDSVEKPTPFLFFSRTRASTDYENSPTAFGATNAVSYNFRNGIGLVAVGSFVASGFTPKAGVQLYRQKGAFLFFGWLVADVKERGSVDLFGLFRYTPALSGRWKLFSQLELFPVYTPSSEAWNLTQRARLGMKYGHWSAGAMADFNQMVFSTATHSTQNLGIFLRHDF